MSDRAVVGAAVAAFAGALRPWSLPGGVVVLACIAAAVGLGARIASLFVGAILVIASGAAANSWSAVQSEAPEQVQGSAVVVSDPTRAGAATTFVLALEGRRYLARAWGPTGWDAAGLSAGTRVRVSGRTSPYGGGRERQAALRTSHRLTVDELEVIDRGLPHWRVANQVRATIESGAQSMGAADAGLFTGLVYGDDRRQDILVAADFRTAGLTHLLAVSGQNVAYVLTILGPVLARLGRRGRFVGGLAALGLFATITRFEPSVMRASVMAALVLGARSAGRDAPPVRVLALATTVLLIADPLLAWTLAFRLSVAACLGIAVLSRRLSEAIPGPQVFGQALGVTLGAQLGVAPLLVSTFGPVSLATVPANLLAGPAAGLAMAWGMTGGILAGIVGGRVAELLHLPTAALIWWLELVARVSAESPLPRVGVAEAAIALVLIGLARAARLSAAVLCGISMLALVIASAPPTGWVRLGWDSLLLGGDHRVLVVGRETSPARLLEDLRRHGISALDDVVVTDSESMPTVALLSGRIAAERIWSPQRTAISTPVTALLLLEAGGARLAVEPGPEGLEVRVVARSGSPPEGHAARVPSQP